MIKQDDIYKIGRIGKPHGVKGELSFQFDDDVFDRVDADYLFILVDGLPVPFFIEEYRFRSDEVALIKFEGIDSEEKATELTGCDVLFPRSLVDGADSETVSKAEIIGYTVLDAANGKTVGRITAVDDSTANMLFQIEAGNDEILIPASPELISDINRKEKTIAINIPEGLLSL